MDKTPKRMNGQNAQPKNSEAEFFADGDELSEFDPASPDGPGEAFEPVEEAEHEPGRLELDDTVVEAETEPEDEIESDEAESEGDEREPGEDEFEEIEEEDLDVEAAGAAMAEMPDDSVRMYLKEIGRVQLLDSDREIWLATQMLAEDRVVQLRAQSVKNKGSLTHSEMLLTLFDDLQVNWEHLIEGVKRHKQEPLDLCQLIREAQALR